MNAMVHHGEHILDMCPFISIGHHEGNSRAHLVNYTRDINLKCKNTTVSSRSP